MKNGTMKIGMMQAFLAAGFAIPAIAAGVTGASAQEAASLIIVHGIQGTDLGQAYIPSLPINVKIDGTCVTMTPVQFGTVAGPYPLATGAHTVKISLANTTAPCSNATIIKAQAGLQAQDQLALVAYENTSGAATTKLFDLTEGTPVNPGVARAVVFNTANTQAVDVTFTDSTGHVITLPDIAPAGRMAGGIPGYTGLAVRVLPTGTTDVLAGPIDFNCSYRSVEALFVVGSGPNGTITVIPKEIHAVY